MPWKINLGLFLQMNIQLPSLCSMGAEQRKKNGKKVDSNLGKSFSVFIYERNGVGGQFSYFLENLQASPLVVAGAWKKCIKNEFSSDYNNNFLTSEKTCRGRTNDDDDLVHCLLIISVVVVVGERRKRDTETERENAHYVFLKALLALTSHLT